MTEQRYEVVIDTEIAHLYEQRERDAQKVHFAEDTVLRSAGARKVLLGENSRHRVWSMTVDEAIATKVKSYEVEHHRLCISDLHEAQAKLLGTEAALEKQNALYTGWARFFLVTASNGHIHSSMHCSTCHLTTQYGWLPELSGLTEADAVKAQGLRLCSICFPTAPVEWTLGLPKSEGCPGTGTYVGARLRYARCPQCSASVSVVPTSGKIRKHKAKETKAA